MALKIVTIFYRDQGHAKTVQVRPEDYDLKPGYVRYKSTEDLWIVLPMSEIIRIEERS